MKYLAVPLVAIALGCVLFALPSIRTSAAPTPASVAFGYDEITRFVMGSATPPPPGSFDADYQAIMANAPAAGTGNSASTPTPGPKRHGLGGMLGSLSNLGSNGSGSLSGMMSGPQAAMQQFQTGKLTRYTYDSTHGWVRTDDPLNQTATIEKCNEHQFINLDLAKKTYTISSTAQKACNTPAMPYGGGRPQSMPPSAPGSSDLTISSTANGLGPKTLDGVATEGYDETMAMATTNSTGSCKNASYKVEMIKYISQIDEKRSYCPLPAGKAAPSYTDAVARGGCKPQMHMKMSGSVHEPVGKLAMYERMVMNMPTAGGGGLSTVTERGHVDWYSSAQADPLFSIPAGFTQSQ